MYFGIETKTCLFWCLYGMTQLHRERSWIALLYGLYCNVTCTFIAIFSFYFWAALLINVFFTYKLNLYITESWLYNGLQYIFILYNYTVHYDLRVKHKYYVSSICQEESYRLQVLVD